MVAHSILLVCVCVRCISIYSTVLDSGEYIVVLFTFGWISSCCYCYCSVIVHIIVNIVVVVALVLVFVVQPSFWLVAFAQWSIFQVVLLRMQVLDFVEEITVQIFLCDAHAYMLNYIRMRNAPTTSNTKWWSVRLQNWRWLIECLDRHSRIPNGHIRHFECNIIALSLSLILAPILLNTSVGCTAFDHGRCTFSCSPFARAIPWKWNIFDFHIANHLSWLTSAKPISLVQKWMSSDGVSNLSFALFFPKSPIFTFYVHTHSICR